MANKPNPADYSPELSGYSGIGKFKAWVQMVLPQVYDDALSYQELVYKMLFYINTLIDDVDSAENNVSELKVAYDNLETYINDWFAELDVQEEVNEKLDQYASDGTLAALIQPLFNAYKTEIDNTVATQNSDIAVLKARMDTFASLPDGSTAGDAELEDIRVGYNGTVYSSAGNAVRNQIGNIHSDLNYLYATGKQLFFENSEITGTQVEAFSVNIPSGTYILNISGITTNDTDSDLSRIEFKAEDNSNILVITLNRNVAITETITLTDTCTSIKFFASNTAAHSSSDTFTYSNVYVSKSLTDTTLSISGKWADAKAVGDRINPLETKMADVIPTWTYLNLAIGRILDNNGSIRINGTVDDTYSDSTGYSNFIYCKAGDKINYKLRGYNNRLLLAVYDSNKTLMPNESIEGGPGYVEGTYTFPSGAEYFRISSLYVDSYYPHLYINYSPVPAYLNGINNKLTSLETTLNNIPVDFGRKTKLFFQPSFKFVLHRGAQTLAPENTIPAFTIAGQNGSWGIETDIFESTDGKFFCFHDDTVDRMTDGTGNIADMNSTEIESLTIDGGSNIEQYPNLKIPTFEEYLNICKKYKCVPVIEIKTITNWQSFLNIIIKKGFETSCVLLGNIGSVVRVRNITNNITYIGLASNATDLTEAITQISAYENTGLDVNSQNANLNSTFIQQAHNKNLIVGIWTINNEESAENWFNSDVDFITSNSIFNITT